ncbi:MULTISPECIES: SymE family type I addiction module toxin [Stenotrophomonas]|jgi:hypothetical protein|uniref:SymE family type I addiction module toxin n=1 Tax=Stenotrophomonas TaxID=40323 RepID=UPI00201CFBEE|nr:MULTISPECIES: SymE family type I addiction module toxin [Stenotrophomonas]MDQ1060868.1 toxic protein SymE [Stenotrophomonas sp. SORGH_AS_0282]MDQ1190786.1 toxic protein SymE [Stenotrophomonas sp. SORGH_AS_0282]UQY87601.1 SymE family type I addiction module toxin [Stenotrophomonas rhizophila]
MHDNKDDSRADARSRVTYHWRMPRTVLIGADRQDDDEPRPGEVLIPSLHLRGMWMTTAGMETGSRVSLHIAPGCLLLRMVNPVVRVACRPGWYQAAQDSTRARW